MRPFKGYGFNLTDSRSVDVELTGQQQEGLPQNVDVHLDETALSLAPQSSGQHTAASILWCRAIGRII